MSGQVSGRIMRRAALRILIYVGSLCMLYFAAYIFATRFTWYPEDFLYKLLKVIQLTSPVWMAFLILAGIIVICFWTLALPLRYLDEVVEASEQLALPDGEPIKLSYELELVQDRLNQAKETAARNAALAKEAEQRKNDLIVYLAHDLKTPITSIVGYLNLLQDEPDISAQQRARFTGIALEKALRLEDLINEFFDITRFNLTSIELYLEKLNLSRMLEQIVFESAPMLEEKDLQWQTDIEDGVWILGDADKLERVVDNLLRNAFSYSYPDTYIRLSLHTEGKDAVLRMQNSGPTIPKEKLDRIFGQFFRLDPGRASRTGGTGLGLAIAREIAEKHGGSILAESERETITLTLRLPLHEGTGERNS